MANFTTVRNTINSQEEAAALLARLQAIYNQAQFAQSTINKYNAATDPTFNAAVNSIFTAGERSQLATMLTNLNTLVGAWTTNHATLLGTQV